MQGTARVTGQCRLGTYAAHADLITCKLTLTLNAMAPLKSVRHGRGLIWRERGTEKELSNI